MAVGNGMPVNRGVITAIICFVLWIAVFKKCSIFFILDFFFEVRERRGIGLNVVILLIEFSYLFFWLFNDAMPTA